MGLYSDEDIVDGRLVFTGVQSVRLDPAGPLPNDLFNEISARPSSLPSGEAVWSFALSIGSVAADGTSTEVVVRIIGEDVHLEDPARAGVKIRD